VSTVAARDAAAEGARLTRATATVSALTLLSRLTGFVRTLVVVAVLGTTYLGNTYQTANGVPNLLFELFAAGALQAVLVPELVQVLDREGRAAADRLAGVVLGALLAGLGLVVLLGALLAPLLSRLLFAGAPASVRADQVWLGTVFLLVFLPQVLFYATGLVSTAALNAEERFAVPAVAPLLNNLVVLAAYGGFWLLRDGDAPSLDLDPLQVAVLAGGTTLGVVVFTAAPWLAARRRGLRLRPRLARHDPALRRVARQGVWAGVFLALTPVLLLTALALGNTVDGGSVVYQYAYQFFLLPQALVAIPIYTALFPTMSRAVHQGRDDDYRSLVARGIQGIWLLMMPATAGMVVLAAPVARLAVLGESAGSAGAVGDAVAAFAPGLGCYGIFLLLSRAAYARGDAKLPAVLHVVVTVVAVTAMALAVVVLDGDARVTGLAGAYSVAYAVGALGLGAALALRHRVGRLADATVLGRGVLAGAAAAAVMVLARQLDVGGGARVDALAQVLVGGVAGVAVYVVAMRALGLGDPRRLLHAGATARG
jgi:putative peptidoglycan lipid II flippase